MSPLVIAPTDPANPAAFHAAADLEKQPWG